MNNNISHTDIYDIEKQYQQKCFICQKTIKEIALLHGGSNIYYKTAFIKHLKIDHDISPNQYFEEICNIQRPYCSCGDCHQKVDFILSGSKWKWKQYKCGRNEGLKKWSIEAKSTRKGAGNPQWGKASWNSGKTKYTDTRIDKISKKLTNKTASIKTRQKQSESAKKRIKHGHTGIKHTEESKQKMRENTLNMIKEGRYKQNKTKCYIAFEQILKNLNIEYKSEYQVNYWSIDFYLLEYDIYIEVDGDYWHSNPKLYPNGPKSYSQKINWENDKRKNKYFEQNNLVLLRFWECDILNNPELIKDTLCKLKK